MLTSWALSSVKARWMCAPAHKPASNPCTPCFCISSYTCPANRRTSSSFFTITGSAALQRRRQPSCQRCDGRWPKFSRRGITTRPRLGRLSALLRMRHADAPSAAWQMQASDSRLEEDLGWVVLVRPWFDDGHSSVPFFLSVAHFTDFS